ncbi:5'-methylthioadenosine/S-adenosylhomocysteine nucleosidase family protein [Arcicella lustrica]|uniref:5'-methylthioadenosine/S-adenosylhomocysteine nucleosidase n=1 Tax=Arcicella lustrica TaxID=2984196 RepID=A0ABU5SDQ3_9BACT|nr:5'-methylthioadenosine/S-adenosylhomocysteine nucleosidase [Arcicella sp. DC25W]MEA5425407.1 5'-methylthioadenosine/S-adenosylhomocysteine nucleosidase [Arcicella sp. DC25W]
MATYKYLDDSFVNAYQSKFNLLIVTATEIEKTVLHEHIKPLPGFTDILQIQTHKYTYYVGVFGVFFTVHVSCNEMGSIGKNASIITTLDAITTWSPKIVLMVGIAFGANKSKQKIGDILVAERIQPYDPQRIGKNDILFRGKEGATSSLLLDRFKSVSGWSYEQKGRIPKIIPGLILSGEKLIDDTLFKNQLMKEYPEAKGGEMEGAGIYTACDQRKVDWILVKGICDFADGNKGKNKHKNQKMAIDSAVTLCELVFSKPSGFKDLGLVVQEDILETDFSEEKGTLPQWILKKDKSLAKEIRNED